MQLPAAPRRPWREGGRRVRGRCYLRGPARVSARSSQGWPGAGAARGKGPPGWPSDLGAQVLVPALPPGGCRGGPSVLPRGIRLPLFQIRTEIRGQKPDTSTQLWARTQACVHRCLAGHGTQCWGLHPRCWGTKGTRSGCSAHRMQQPTAREGCDRVGMDCVRAWPAMAWQECWGGGGGVVRPGG